MMPWVGLRSDDVVLSDHTHFSLALATDQAQISMLNNKHLYELEKFVYRIRR